MAYWSKDPQRGDVVGMRAPDGDLYIKRIVGLPGDIVEIRDGTLIVNDQRLDDPQQAPLQRIYGPARLGKDEYFIIGDNRFISVYGPISRESILGKIVL
jgi:signal peptidase I